MNERWLNRFLGHMLTEVLMRRRPFKFTSLFYILASDIRLIKYEFLNEVDGGVCFIWVCYISTEPSF